MNILFVTGGTPPTVYALSPLATALRNMGHHVVLATTRPSSAAAIHMGLPVFVYADSDVREYIHTDSTGRRVEIPDDVTEQQIFTGEWFGRMNRAGLTKLRELVESWRPHLIVGGTMSYAAPLLAYEFSVPYVRHTWDISDPTLMDIGAERELEAELASLGLSELPKPARVVDLCPPSISHGVYDDAIQMRWTPAVRQREVEPWMMEGSPDRPRICVTSGHRVARDQNYEFLRDLASTMKDSQLEVVIAAPEDVSAELRSELPGVRAGWMPLNLLLPTCAGIVNHAGGLTVLTGLACGTPQLVLPARDAKSLIPAERLKRQGCAKVLYGDQEDAASIRSGVEEIVRETRYRHAANLLYEEMRNLPDANEVGKILLEEVAVQ